ncbi:MAG: DUF1282 domain-containing protein [Bacteroidetes bacterium]|nr:MAG: DUF1282 domain-containing protein [Bacteroidota bacterium]
MNLIERVKNILLKPKQEWLEISSETATPGQLATGYVLPLAGLSAAAAFIGMGLIGTTTFGIKVGGTINHGINQAVMVLVTSLVSFFITTYVVDALAPSFKSEKDLGKSAQLVAYASTASYVGGMFSILPAIAILGSLLGLYGLYLLYLGLPILKKTPDEQRIPYLVVSILVLIVVYFALTIVIGLILAPILGITAAGMLGK